MNDDSMTDAWANSPADLPLSTNPAISPAEINLAISPFNQAIAEMGRSIVGQEKLVHRMMVALLTGGHLLIEGVPGLAKTTAVSALSSVAGLSNSRLQFTPDLLPADLIGTQVYRPSEEKFVVQKGPVFANLVLADEINRAPAKVQSALLEAMQEQQVTIGGESFQLPQPFMVMATQNPIEQEGTYRLPEAQLDRFLMKVVLDYPSRDEEIQILQSRAKSKVEMTLTKCLSQSDILRARDVVDRVLLSDSIQEYIVDLVISTRRPQAYGLPLDEMIAVGASPRASISLALAARAAALLQGRNFVAPEDVKSIAADVLRHRFTLTYEAEAEGVTDANVLDTILGGVRIG